MMAIEGVARVVSLDAKHPANGASKHLLSFLSALNQLNGWQHVQRYVLDPLQYPERAKQLMYGGAKPTCVVAGSMDDFQDRGLRLVKRMCHRVDWILELQRKSNRSFDADLNLKVIAADREWAADADSFMKEAEQKVTEMLSLNQKKN